jgi:hypothetical protein
VELNLLLVCANVESLDLAIFTICFPHLGD